MPYHHHPELPSTPAGDTVIWRYLSVAELLDLLDNQALHFTRADRFNDSSIDVENQVALALASGLAPEPIRRSFQLMQSAQTAVFANSWHQGNSDLHKNWVLYGGAKNQIAIRTTIKTLQSSFSRATQKLYLSGVQYLDFSKTPMPTGNVFLPAIYKQHALCNEKELRVLFLQTGGQKVFTPGPIQGVDVDVNLHSLIQAICIAPRTATWLRGLVISLSHRYGLTHEIIPTLPTFQPKSHCRSGKANGCGVCPRAVLPIDSARANSFLTPACKQERIQI